MHQEFDVVRLRKRITLARIAIIPAIVAVTFALGTRAHAPWNVSAFVAGLFTLPVFVTGVTPFQWFTFYCVAGVVVGLLFPTIASCPAMSGSRPPSSITVPSPDVPAPAPP